MKGVVGGRDKGVKGVGRRDKGEKRGEIIKKKKKEKKCRCM